MQGLFGLYVQKIFFTFDKTNKENTKLHKMKNKKIVYLEGVILPLLSLWHVFKHLTIHPPLSPYYYTTAS